MKNIPQIEEALRLIADKMARDPDSFTHEEGRAMDRALRTCPNITDIDRIWVLWSYVAKTRGWLTDHEMTYDKKKGRYVYPS